MSNCHTIYHNGMNCRKKQLIQCTTHSQIHLQLPRVLKKNIRYVYNNAPKAGGLPRELSDTDYTSVKISRQLHSSFLQVILIVQLPTAAPRNDKFNRAFAGARQNGVDVDVRYWISCGREGLFFSIHHTAQVLLPQISTSLEPSEFPSMRKGLGVMKRLLKKCLRVQNSNL